MREVIARSVTPIEHGHRLKLGTDHVVHHSVCIVNCAWSLVSQSPIKIASAMNRLPQLHFFSSLLAVSVCIQGCQPESIQGAATLKKATVQTEQKVSLEELRRQRDELESRLTPDEIYLVGQLHLSGLKGDTPGDPALAFRSFLNAGQRGQVEAQRWLGHLYRLGNGVERDLNKAGLWYEKAAVKGDAEAQYYLAMAFYLGQGFEQDYTRAFYWGLKAAEQGHTQAEISIGMAYWLGEGVAPDFSKAYGWFEKGAAQGEANAQHYLATMLMWGEGTDKNSISAVKWFRQAAEQGFGLSQLELGKAYHQGTGVAVDLKEAALWYQRAADQGIDEAVTALSELSKPRVRMINWGDYNSRQSITYYNHGYAYLLPEIAFSKGGTRRLYFEAGYMEASKSNERLCEPNKYAPSEGEHSKAIWEFNGQAISMTVTCYGKGDGDVWFSATPQSAAGLSYVVNLLRESKDPVNVVALGGKMRLPIAAQGFSAEWNTMSASAL